MRRFLSGLPLLVLAVALAGCSGGSIPVATDLDRSATEAGGGSPPQPPRGCPRFFDIILSHRGPGPDPITHPGHLMVDACVNPNEPNHAAIAFKLREGDHILRIPGIRVDCPEGANGECFRGHRLEERGTEERGVRIVWNTAFSIRETNQGPRVMGELIRNRTRWFTRPNGEKQEDFDRLVLQFQGRPGAAPPPPPPPPPPPGDGGGDSGGPGNG